jgi:hypothetical protein
MNICFIRVCHADVHCSGQDGGERVGDQSTRRAVFREGGINRARRRSGWRTCCFMVVSAECLDSEAT